MPTLSYQAIAPLLPEFSGNLYIAYSGGVDSHVLLHLCAQQFQLRNKIVAVYVDHGLQTQAKSWGEHCHQQADNLGVRFMSLQVNANAQNGDSPEAAARDARYQALQNQIKTGDLLLVAQHREDQMETVLLQLFRGAGVQGLAAMPVSTVFGAGRLLRPLLNTAKAEILAYAQRHRLNWVEDPSNLSSDFDRNFLRNEIVPLLKQRWPAMDKTLARSAQHCADAAELIEDSSCEMIKDRFNPADQSLSLEKIEHLSSAQYNLLLRQWFRELGLKPPSQAQLNSFKQQLLGARADATPQINLQGHIFQKYRQQLFCLSKQELLPIDEKEWPQDSVNFSLSNGYILSRTSAESGINQQLWHQAKITLKPRSGGEKLKLPGRMGQHCLKKLFQEAGIPPWERQTRPLIFLDDRLAAVAGLWIAEWAWAKAPVDNYQISWQQLLRPAHFLRQDDDITTL
jgi:tRNA(Ile)-lysidine synthase